eukprot:Gregarina_sp_Pseudo_9__11@NODE_1008_length_1974_cov_17_270801_g945_i0_p2_GENE_NODE_1008_length_1974_cov_17_270801_g945_i0NODE_1008_length_1974_cov_17_270801_g945_i0_p2_ORF_typecomplete_len500_score124_65cEGF/PF12662_7/5_7e02cEGF/PF12662_7/5_6e03cEGF/PF12662_7/4_3e03cEGF/PF12662_7/5_1e03cEGF/PF12662_7/0_062Mfp3/PF04202_13/1_7_NODE_1008_length_1974_cov_17_270801_g945_i01901689
MLPLRFIIGAFLLPVVLGHEDDALGGQKKKGGYVYSAPLPVPMPVPVPHEKIKKATPYDVSEPIYTCPKPGYVLHGEDCVFVDTVPARFECPIGFEPEGGHPGHPKICTRTTPAVMTCARGKLINGMCQIAEYTDATLVCPPGIERTPEGVCVRFEQVAPIERCPPHSSRIQGHCVEINYHEPAFVCPHDTVQEGRKCRREIVAFKEKHRKLSEAGEGEAAVAEDAAEVLEGAEAGEEVDLFVDLPDHIFESDNIPLGQAELQGGKKIDSTWLPAYYDEYEPFERKYEYKYDKYDKYDKHEWKQLEVPIAVPEVITTKGHAKTVKVKEPQPKIKEVKIKVPKPPPPPQQIIKVQYLPAEKVCEIGEKHGGACITQTHTPPIIECPVPLIHGACVRKVVVPPITTCPVGLELVCPPRVPGHRCRCEKIIEVPPTPTCPVGTLDPVRLVCISTAPPKEYCPLGYFLDPNGKTCTKRDVEAALCLFQVTYVCPDCDKHHHHY